MVPINTLFLLAVLAGLVFLQIFLSKSESRWPGLLLPAIFMLFSLIAVFGVMAYDSVWQTIGLVLSVFLLNNIPTAVFLTIYFVLRGKRKKRDELEKMNRQELE